MKRKVSRIHPFEDEMRSLRTQGVSYRGIAEHLQSTHGVKVSHNAVYSFLKIRDEKHRSGRMFFEGLPGDIRESLLKQLAALWTYDSTVMEGNTLTLGDTVKVLELGLTIHGKPLKDHEEVYGHAKAIDVVYDLVKAGRMTDEDLFTLHRCVMQKTAIDSLRPVGAWKRDYNGTTGLQNGKPVYMEYASPLDTPFLMKRWLREYSRKLKTARSAVQAVNVYSWVHMSFVRIHPFFDGNGRIARLVANLPLLHCGHPPLLISPEQRLEYIQYLWEYQSATGVIKRNDCFVPSHPALADFKVFLREQWQSSLELVNTARVQSDQRGQA